MKIKYHGLRGEARRLDLSPRTWRTPIVSALFALAYKDICGSSSAKLAGKNVREELPWSELDVNCEIS